MVGDVVDGEFSGEARLYRWVRKFALSVTDLDIDRSTASIRLTHLCRAGQGDGRKDPVAGAGCHQRQEGQADLRGCDAGRALEFKRSAGACLATSQDAWERKMAEGIAFLQRHAAKAAADGW
jgi:hypothetical protein